MAGDTEGVAKGFVEGLLDALSDKHSQLDIRLDGLSLNLGDSSLGLRLSGTVSVAVHMRGLTSAEKDAHVAANIAKIHA